MIDIAIVVFLLISAAFGFWIGFNIGRDLGTKDGIKLAFNIMDKGDPHTELAARALFTNKPQK
jgi:hypothetical protein